ncbi:DUF5011 domain-containing protein, partial [Verrucomicrobia bacterium]|nr:DUF5011 domain-containing protein [Verrucomicrobiota bacterium]
ESLPIIGEPASLPTHWELRDGYLVDVTSPTLSLIGPQQLTHQFGTEYIDRGATATDNEGFAIEVIAGGAVDGMMAGVYEIEYTATDDSGNISSIIRTITVVDTIAPTLSLNGSPKVVHEAGVEYVDSGATAIDNVDGVLNVVVTEQIDVMTVGDYQIQYTATDNSGNIGSVTRIVTVEDNTAPTIQLIEGSPNVVEVGQLYSDPGVIALDSIDGNPSVSVEISGNAEAVSDGEYKSLVVEPFALIYTATDKAGNTTTLTREVKVTPDVTPPQIELIGDFFNNIYVSHETEMDLLGFNQKLKEWDPGVIVSDKVDSEIKIESSYIDPHLFIGIEEKISENSDKLFEMFYNDVTRSGLYALYYRATDSSGNSSLTHRVVQVRPKGADFYTEEELPTAKFGAPVITLNGPIHVYVNLGDLYEEQGATAKDAEDVSVEVTIGAGKFDTDILGNNYEVNYYAQDRFGNSSSATRYVNVIDPNARLLKFKINNDSVSVVDCSESISGGLTIPSSWEGKPVTSIGSYAFKDCRGLKSVTIPDSVTSIGRGAFLYCKSLKSVTIPDSVISIGKEAFYYCDALKSVTIGDSVTSIGDEAFKNCRGLTSVTIGDSVTSIGRAAFNDCRIKSVTIPDSVTFIGAYAFVWCSQLKSVTFEGNAPRLGLGTGPEKGLFTAFKGAYAKVYVKANATGFDTTFGGKPVVREGSITTASKGNTSDGPIMGAVVFFDVNLNGLPDEGEPQTKSNGWGDYWLDIPLEIYDLNGNGVIDISEGMIVSQGGTDTATGLPMKTVLKGPASATVITPLTTLVT